MPHEIRELEYATFLSHEHNRKDKSPTPGRWSLPDFQTNNNGIIESNTWAQPWSSPLGLAKAIYYFTDYQTSKAYMGYRLAASTFEVNLCIARRLRETS